MYTNIFIIRNVAVDINKIIFACAWNLRRPELELQNLLSPMMDWRETVRVMQILDRNFFFCFTTSVSSNDYRSEKIRRRRTGSFLHMLTTSRGDHVCVCQITLVMSSSVRSYGQQPARHLCPWDSPGMNAGAGCHALLQGICPPQGSNPDLYVSCTDRQVLHHERPLGSPINHRK